MKNIQSKFFSWALCVLLVFSFQNSIAGHILGANISYSYVGPNTYLVNVTFYRDCQGLPAPNTVTVCYSSIAAGFSNTMQLSAMPGGQYYLPNFPYFPALPTSCVGGPAIGIELNIYQGVINVPSAQSDWIMSYSTFPQNIGIGQNFMYVSTTIDNINYPTNQSSIYAYNPTFIYCINQPAWDNFYSTDADGDSLSYHLTPNFDNTTVCPSAPFINPLPPFNPLVSSTPIVMDSTNGSLTFHPTAVGQAMVSARVDEFRNGILINSTTRQHVMYLVTGCTITGIHETENDNISISPNPASDELHFNLSGNINMVNAEITDLTGKIIEVKPISSTGSKNVINIKNLPGGIYILKVNTETSLSVKKFIKN